MIIFIQIDNNTESELKQNSVMIASLLRMSLQPIFILIPNGMQLSMESVKWT